MTRKETTRYLPLLKWLNSPLNGEVNVVEAGRGRWAIVKGDNNAQPEAGEWVLTITGNLCRFNTANYDKYTAHNRGAVVALYTLSTGRKI